VTRSRAFPSFTASCAESPTLRILVSMFFRAEAVDGLTNEADKDVRFFAPS